MSFRTEYVYINFDPFSSTEIMLPNLNAYQVIKLVNAVCSFHKVIWHLAGFL